jgi:hypothetical protein
MASFDRYPLAGDVRRARFVVSQDEKGRWVAHEQVQGLVHGVFRTQRDAIRFALFECGYRSPAVVLQQPADAGAAA